MTYSVRLDTVGEGGVGAPAGVDYVDLYGETPDMHNIVSWWDALDPYLTDCCGGYGCGCRAPWEDTCEDTGEDTDDRRDLRGDGSENG